MVFTCENRALGAMKRTKWSYYSEELASRNQVGIRLAFGLFWKRTNRSVAVVRIALDDRMRLDDSRHVRQSTLQRKEIDEASEDHGRPDMVLENVTYVIKIQ